jgi:hypothetical protein
MKCIKKIDIYYYILFLFVSNVFSEGENSNIVKQKSYTCCIPFSDAHTARYNYHKPLELDFFADSHSWLIKTGISYRYQQTFNGNVLAASMFQFNPVTAKYVLNLNNNLSGGNLAIGFGENNADSEMCLDAKINNNYVDFSFDLEKSDSNFYLHAAIPIQRAANKLNINENVKTNRKVIKGGFTPEYKDSDVANLISWQETASDEVSAVGSLSKYFFGNITGDMQERLFNKMCPCKTISEWSISDIYLQLGWNGFKRKTLEMGLYVKGVIPTSPKLDASWARYIFSPVIGNVGRSEFGIGFNSHCWIKDLEESSLRSTLDIYLAHVFGNTHVRTFDLINGPMTRYANCKIFDQNLNYQNSLVWVADLTTQCVNVCIPLKAEIILDIIYQYRNHNFNFGYDFKGSSKEQTDCCFRINKGIYGLNCQEYVQIPNPLKSATNQWITDYVTPNSNMYEVSRSDISLYRATDNEIVGIPMTLNYALNSSSIDVRSGLMGGMILNIIFGGYQYAWTDYCYEPIFAIKGSVGWSTTNNYTSEYCDIYTSFSISY